jgi:pyruvate/2-oxoglutarate dehydrogenase complex dihydrolipoamide acyltransferase (E2) component
VTVTLSSDHRVIDGVRAAAFLADLAVLIEHARRSLP